jgi:glycoprotein endo-alpha-1,2-mannosidase
MHVQTASRVAAGVGVMMLLLACGPTIPPTTPGPSADSSSAVATAAPSTPLSIASPELPPVEGPDPSKQVAAFYYPWYGDVHWNHPGTGASVAADDIASDYYPVLGPYDSADRQVVAQHMAWLRSAGIGVIVTSWWGRGTREDALTPLVMEMAERYGIKVAFHIEPHGDRTADGLVADVAYIEARYGSMPSFLRMVAQTPWSKRAQPQGLYFMFGIDTAGSSPNAVDAAYWRPALDTIHASPAGGLVIAATTDAAWLERAHVDGLYNYVSADARFDWAPSLPLGALYVPSVTPGESARRIGYPLSADFPRAEGATYDAQWKAALATGVKPTLVTITSFNEWHEGTQIEPALADHVAATGRRYLDYAPFDPKGYLVRSRAWVDRLAATRWPATYRVRIRIQTTSDWTTLRIGGATVTRPLRVAISGKTVQAHFDGSQFVLTQSLSDANAGRSVTVTFDLLLGGITTRSAVSARIERGNIGKTTVTLYNYLHQRPVQVASTTWSGITSGPNRVTVRWPARLVTTSPAAD